MARKSAKALVRPVVEITPQPSLPAHSKIGASSMHRWSVCPGSVKLCSGIPNRTSKYAEEGTEAHDLASFRLMEGCYDKHPSAEDDEMLDAVEVYVNFVEELAKGSTLYVEHKFDLSGVYPGLFGTADAVVYQPGTKTLHVIDYKHGAGIPVEVSEFNSDGLEVGNDQLMYYAVGALVTLKLQVERVILTIVQPRAPHKDGPIRSWETTPAVLLDFTSDLVDFAKQTEKPDAKLLPGDHCRFCPAAGICPEIENKATELAKEAFSPVESSTNIDYERIGKLLNWLPVLEGWVKGVRDFAYSEAEHGKKIPGWKLVAKRATRKWTDEVKISRFLESEFPQTAREFYTRDLKSPAQIEKILATNQHAKLLPYLTAVSSGNTLVVEADKREEVATLSASEAFTQIGTEADLFS